MTTLPTVSVIVVVRNERYFISETIESILSQNYPALEVYVQDGGSTDGTVEILKQYPVQWVSERDKSIAEGANRGFRATSGEFIVFQGGDDLMLPGSIQTLAQALAQNPKAGFVYGDAEVIDATGRPYQYRKGRPFDLDDMFWGNYILSQTVMARRSAMAQVGLYSEDVVAADGELRLRMGALYPSIYIPQLLARYRIHAGSTTLNNMAERARTDCLIANRLLKDPIITRQLRRGIPHAYAGSYFVAAKYFVRARQMSKAWQTYFQAIRRYPPAAVSTKGLKVLWAFLLGPERYDRFCNRGRSPG
jgi:glycosyltransferase involved in cell wall biosynthesis